MLGQLQESLFASVPTDQAPVVQQFRLHAINLYSLHNFNLLASLPWQAMLTTRVTNAATVLHIYAASRYSCDLTACGDFVHFRLQPSAHGPLVIKFLMEGIPGESAASHKVDYLSMFNRGQQ